jgi:hypothetical protein
MCSWRGAGGSARGGVAARIEESDAVSRAVTIVALLFIAFLTVGASSCGEADKEEPPPASTPVSQVTGDVDAAPSAPALAAPSDQAFSVETLAPTDTSAPAPTAQEPTPSPTPDFSGEEVTLFSNSNDGVIRDGATGPATLVLEAPALVTYVQTYHWHKGKGVKPGTISVTGPDGTVYGPWQAAGTDGQGGVKNAYWEAKPMVELAPGTYLVDDSDPATRGTNDGMGGIGQTIVRGIVAAP